MDIRGRNLAIRPVSVTHIARLHADCRAPTPQNRLHTHTHTLGTSDAVILRRWRPATQSHLHDPLGELLEAASDTSVPESLDDQHLLRGRRPVEVVIARRIVLDLNFLPPVSKNPHRPTEGFCPCQGKNQATQD